MKADLLWDLTPDVQHCNDNRDLFVQEVSVERNCIGAEKDPTCQNSCDISDDSSPFLQLISAKQDELSANGDWRSRGKACNNTFI